MFVKRGIAVSPGLVTGPALVLGTEDFRIPQVYVAVDAVETEVARFHLALDAVCREITENEELATARIGSQYGAIFGAHLQMVRDPSLVDGIEKLIRERSFSPEFACSRVIRKYAGELQNLGNSFLAERAVDLFDLEKRLLRHLLGERREELAHLTAPVIVLAHDLTPSETSRLDKKFVLGFATEGGGPHEPYRHSRRRARNPGHCRSGELSQRRLGRGSRHSRRRSRRNHRRPRRGHP